MSRMIFVLWSRTGSYPVWKSIDFYLQVTCLRLGLTVGNSFFLPVGRGNEENCSERPVSLPEAQELRVPFHPRMGGSVLSYPGFPRPASSLSSSSSGNLHRLPRASLHRKEGPSTSNCVQLTSRCCLCLPIFHPRGIQVSTADWEGKGGPPQPGKHTCTQLSRMFYQFFNSGSGNIIQPM